QFVHMYLRYLGWNYVGTEGDWKDAGVNWKQLYGIPLFLGLLGLIVHWRKDPKMATVVTAAFLVMGLALVINRNFQEPEVRERDYFFVGSFFVYSLWIGMGALGLIDWFRTKQPPSRSAVAGFGVLALALVFVPLNMLRTNFPQMNRTGNYAVWDYAYNVLQSCERDAILFTNGDNDTYPLWYLQDVEGVRRDIRIVCLSLLNRDWYITQLKHEQPFGAKEIPISMSDAEIESASGRLFSPRTVALPVPAHTLRQFNIEEPAARRSPLNGEEAIDTLSFTAPATIEFEGGKALRVQDVAASDIVVSTAWQRPIYFAMTVPTEGQIGLNEYLQLEGLVFRLTPRRRTSLWSNVDDIRTRAHLFFTVNAPSTSAATGCRWRGLQDSTTHLDEDVRHLLSNYRQAFILLARHYISEPEKAPQAAEILDRMEKVLPRRTWSMDYRTKMYVAGLYKSAGAIDKFNRVCDELVSTLIPLANKEVAGPLTGNNPFVLLLQTYEMMGRFDDALSVNDVIHSLYSGEKNIELIFGQTRSVLLSEQASAQRPDSLARATSSKGK
ncbi:MAG TPA: hypothetical protein VMH23_09290, partial [Bacteroidota bacterium]|nr:hypothetical protein [Bacteroidota bacterium]